MILFVNKTCAPFARPPSKKYTIHDSAPPPPSIYTTLPLAPKLFKLAAEFVLKLEKMGYEL